MQLREYQILAKTKLAQKFATGNRTCVLQLPTGAGKTICFAAIAESYTAKSGKSALILVHRKELLLQTRLTLFNAYNIDAQVIIAGMKHVPKAKVYVGMIESVVRRIDMIHNVGMVIIDECHIDSFNKIHEFYPNELILGVTATPLTANRAKPLKNYYQDIVVGPSIQYLIEQKSLCQNVTFAPKNTVDRKALKVKNGEYDEGLMAMAFSAPKYVQSTIQAYKQHCNNQKVIIFNCNIDHSIKVNDAFVEAGFNSRHLDGTMGAKDRTETLTWFKNTPNAILNNIGILTAGFDEPSIECVIFNKATLSMPLWLQCTGRGSRPTESKEAFTIIDMGGNTMKHGDWSSPRDWEDIFFNPPKKNEDGVAPIKECPECDAIIPVQCKECPQCGFVFPGNKKSEEEEIIDAFVVVTKNIDAKQIIESNKHKKQYASVYAMAEKLAEATKQIYKNIDNQIVESALERMLEMMQDFCTTHGKRFNQWNKDFARDALYDKMQDKFKKWKRPARSLELSTQTTEPTPTNNNLTIFEPIQSLKKLNFIK